MEELIKKAEKIVNKKYSNDDSFYALYVLCCFALLTKFKDNQDVVEDVMLNTNFYIDYKSISDLIRENSIVVEDTENYEYLSDESMKVAAISIPGICIESGENSISYSTHSPSVFCSLLGNTTNEVLNAITHELAHIVKSRNNVILEESPTTLITRSGLNIYGKLFDDDGDLCEINENLLLDEIINVLQCSDMMREVKSLPISAMSDEVKDFYGMLDLDTLDSYYGYNDMIDFVAPLWSCEHFRTIVDENIVNGYLGEIYFQFDQMVGEGSFKDYSNRLDILDAQYDNDELWKEMTEWFSNINSSYKKNSESSEKIH